MKNSVSFVRLCALLLLVAAMSLPVAAQKKATNVQRVAYVLRNAEINRATQAKLKPLLEEYLRDKDAAEERYEKMKNLYRPRMKMGTLTDEQAQQLLNAKWEADEKELAVKRDYEEKFKTVVPTKTVWVCFDLLNDKDKKVLE